MPTAYDAWEIEPYHDQTRRECEGARSLRAEVAFEHAIGVASSLRQVVRLDAHARRLEFRTHVDWAERHRLLKVVFPVLVRAQEATYEMQFGVQARPTHVNTDADLARFEVPFHRFADLSEHGFGVALLTDSTYGFSTRGGELRLSLLRGPTDPDPEADLGGHDFAYAILPHAGTWQDAGVVGEARRFDEPMRWTGAAGGARGFVEVDAAGLVLDTIKRAEDGGALVLRLYEAHGTRARLGTLLEEPDPGAPPLEIEDDAIVVPFSPFQLLTVLVE